MKKIKTSISLDENIYNQVKEIANKEDRSFSQQVNNILKDFLGSLDIEKER
jgi:predicted DNA-binding ribbon-helix-helix protein